MRIVHILNYTWENGGASKVVYDLSLRHINAGHKVEIWSTEKEGFKPYISDKKLVVKSFKPGFLTKFFPLFSFSLWKSIKNGDFDIIHVHGMWNFGALASFLANLESKTVVTVHGTLHQNTFNGHTIKKGLFSFLFQKKFLKKVKGIQALHTNEAHEVESYLGYRPRQLRVIANGLPLNEMSLGNAAKNHNVLFMSRLAENKGLQLLLPAFKEVLKSLPSAKLIIAGPDFGMLAYVQNFISTHNLDQNISVAGTLSGKEKEKAQNEAMVFTLPSYSEGFSIAVLEAMQKGLVLLISDETGVSDKVEEYNAGIIVKHNIEDISDKLISLLTDEKLRVDCIRNAQILLQKHYDIDKIANEVLAMYKNQVITN